MRHQKLRVGFIASVLIVIGTVLIALSHATFPAREKRQASKRAFLYPPGQIQHFTLGYREIAADSLWLRVLQDFDVCEQEMRASGGAKCQNGWVYSMIRSIIDLDPRFRMPYVAGSQILSIAVDDRKGAAEIYDLAVEKYPTDRQLLMRAAYHFMIEMGQEQKAADLLVRAGKNGAPPWVFALAGRLYSKEGQLELARNVLHEVIQSGQFKEYEERIHERYREIQEKLTQEDRQSSQ